MFVGGICSILDTVEGNGHCNPSSNPGQHWLYFYIALIHLGKVWIQLSSLELWVNNKADWDLQPWYGN